jgi:hypothetical protein
VNRFQWARTQTHRANAPSMRLYARPSAWVRRARNGPHRRFPARAPMTMTYHAPGWLADALGWLACRHAAPRPRGVRARAQQQQRPQPEHHGPPGAEATCREYVSRCRMSL